MRYAALLMILPLGLMACVPEPVTPAPPPIEDACGASALQGLVGQSAKKLEVMRFATTVRIIRPGMAVMMNYVPERLNIDINAAEVITRVSCG
ncbi:MAG: hypothetical protein CFE33_16320 [Pseudorhodobacter sp. PARRP1]|nr:MAG: hypothetical protein CFE33_16320 [Pseudorhodobacter sp. PARRP1]